MNKRTDAREVAFKLVFEYLFSGEVNEQTFTGLCSEAQITTETEYIKNVYYGVIKNYESLQNIITTYSEGFKIDRVFKVDKAILLVAIYEILYMTDVPYLVSINEALNLAKKYSTEKSTSYINGILGRLNKDGNN